MKKIAAVLLLLLALCGCGEKVEKPIQTDPPVPITERVIPETEAPAGIPTEARTEPTEPRRLGSGVGDRLHTRDPGVG